MNAPFASSLLPFDSEILEGKSNHSVSPARTNLTIVALQLLGWRTFGGRLLLDLHGVETAFQNERVVTVEFNRVQSRRRKLQAEEVEGQFHGGVDVGQLNLAVDIGDGGVGFFVDDA